MSAREQFSWVWLATLVVAYGAYFTAVAMLGRPTPFLANFGLLAAVTLSTAAIAGGATWLIRRRFKGARPVEDERDRAIEQRSSAAAYVVLMGGMIVVGCIMPFQASGWDVVHAAVFAIVLAELVHHGVIVAGYRRGWRV